MKSPFKKTKFVIAMLLFSVILVSAATATYAANIGARSWYCVHVPDHKQPTVGDDISFIEQYGGYYIDKKHGDDCDDKVIYLTFDAGYENGNVAKILDVMKEEEVTGAFFYTQ